MPLTLHHAAHVSVVVAVAAGVGFLLRKLGDEALGGEEKAADGGGVLQGTAGDLRGVNHAAGDEVFE